MTSGSRDASLNALRAALDRPPPAGLDTLEPAELAKLATLLTEAKQRQKAQVDIALTESLSHVPLLLRGAVRKILDL
ncbi:hypothetical protein [Nevskia sp.]|uniref:hypothetical protein n=1 Tax=Nevskia sp. TaxID=1929292 RepID=UPI0025D45935|nr:hypothetical protein [Nevskia sp.]